MHHAVSDPTRHAPGQYVRASSQRLRLRTLVVLGVIAIASAAAARALGLQDATFLSVELVLAFALLGVAHYAIPLVHRRDLGAGGEEHVGSVLAALDERWSVIHDVRIGAGNIDHIVIGPGGVFAIETKARAGNVRVRDVHGATLHQARAQRRALEEITGTSVEPLLVFSRAWVDRPLARRGGVRVLPARMLIKHLRARPTVLGPADVESARGLIETHLRARAHSRPTARSVAHWR
jgi:Nuclease-related domain